SHLLRGVALSGGNVTAERPGGDPSAPRGFKANDKMMLPLPRTHDGSHHTPNAFEAEEVAGGESSSSSYTISPIIVLHQLFPARYDGRIPTLSREKYGSIRM
ncbi:hypothetical protein HAX54_007154, partial [Datura stramonium]|nr:hypothetical protein [Datura stramonium]